MAGGYVSKILSARQRLGVLRTMPILTGDHRKDTLQGKQKLDLGGNLLLDYLHVDSADRICYFDLRPETMTYPYLHLHLENAQTSTVHTSWGKAKQLRPCFYLPYRKNNASRMKLSEPAGYGGDEVRFFATATIDGCSVYVEGPNATPKVTHLNAQRVATTTTTDTWLQKQVKIQQKITHMDTQYGHIRKTGATVVERPDYIADDPAEVVRVKQAFALAKGIPVAQVVSYQPFGAVIGVKDGTDWTFYMQKNGTFEFRRTPTGGLLSAYFVLETREFWPNGGGAFRTIP
jgi:hypothetical protein